METIVSIVKTSVGIFVTTTVWFLWMGYVRRWSGCRHDQDVLEHVAHGCGGCKGEGACHSSKGRGEHHELA